MNKFELGNKIVDLERAANLLNVYVDFCYTENPYACKLIEKDLASISTFADRANDRLCMLEIANDIVTKLCEYLWEFVESSDKSCNPDTPKKGAA